MAKSSRRQLVLVAILAVVGAVSVGVWFGWIPNQRHNLRVANAHADCLRSTLGADARWSEIRFGSYTGGPSPGGCFAVQGTVRTAEDARSLARLVVASKPAVPIWWLVAPEETTAFRHSVIIELPFDLSKVDEELANQAKLLKESGE